MKNPKNIIYTGSPIAKALSCLDVPDVRRATVFVSPLVTVKATRRFRMRKDEKSLEAVLSIGKPNFRDRLRVREFVKAGVPFPVKKVQLDFWPRKKKGSK